MVNHCPYFTCTPSYLLYYFLLIYFYIEEYKYIKLVKMYIHGRELKEIHKIIYIKVPPPPPPPKKKIYENIFSMNILDTWGGARKGETNPLSASTQL